MALYKAALQGVNLPGNLHSDPAYNLGSRIGNFAPKLLSPFTLAAKKSPYFGAGVGALTGAGIGGLLSYLRGGKLGKGALIGGLIGGAGLGGLGYYRNNPINWSSFNNHSKRKNNLVSDENSLIEKYGMYKKAYGLSHGDDVTSKIYRDTSLTLRQKNELATQVNYLNQQQKSRLSQLLAGAFGGGIGMIVAKYLLGLGKFGTILTAIVSGVGAASTFGSRSGKSPFDRRGRPYYM